MLAPVALVVLARLVDVPGSLGLALAATGLLAGLGTTMSRTGALALMTGLVVLAVFRGLRRTARAALGPCAGALVALVCLAPSMPAAPPTRPALALTGLCTGLALAAVLARLRRWPAITLVLGGALLGCSPCRPPSAGRLTRPGRWPRCDSPLLHPSAAGRCAPPYGWWPSIP